jgi:hypothetical protein
MPDFSVIYDTIKPLFLRPSKKRYETFSASNAYDGMCMRPGPG